MSERFSGVGGVPIEWRSWTPLEDPRAVVVISHGAGEHAGRYEHVAAGLMDARLAVFHSRPHAFLGHHGIDRKMLANLAQEIEVADRFGPRRIVEQAASLISPASTAHSMPLE